MSVKRYTIYYNERERDMYVAESQDGKYVLHSDYAALEARHNALVEAVAWERECIRQLDHVGKFWDDNNVPGRELIMIFDAARSEVDRLLEEGK